MTTTPTRAPRRWWTRWWVWAIVVALLASVVTVGLIAGRDPSTPAIPAAPPPTVNKPSVPSVPPSGDYTGNDVDALGRGMRIPAAPDGRPLPPSGEESGRELGSPIPAPAGLEWQRVYGVGMPFSTADGPRTLTGGVPDGFSRSPQGAALAGLQLLLRATFGPPAVRSAVLDTAAIGPDTLKQQLRGADNDPQYQTIPAALQITPDQYTPTTATVRWAFGPFPAPEDFPTATGTYYTTASVPVVWDAGRWKLRLTPRLLSSDEGRVESIDQAGWSTWF